MERKPFSPTGKTIRVVAASTAPTAIQAPESGTGGGYQFRLYNAGSVTAYVSVGVNAAAAEAAAIIPDGTSQFSIPLPAGIVEVLSFPIGSYFTAVTAASTANVFITPGKGL